MAKPFTARYDSECRRCDGSIWAGEDELVMTDDDGAVHVECAEDGELDRGPVTLPLD